MGCFPAGCGGELSGPSGSISSPGYPVKYPDNTECIWYITSTAGSSITLTIHEFDVEFHPDCNYDVLEVSFDFNSLHSRKQLVCFGVQSLVTCKKFQ